MARNDYSTACPECGGTDLRWTAQTSKGFSPIPDGRLQMHDVSVILVLGCDECSETVQIVDADSEAGAEVLNP